MGLIHREFKPIYDDPDKLARDISSAIWKLHSEGTGCSWFPLMYTKRVVWAIVVGWSNSFDDECICAKIACQPLNSGMQCDFDLDWNILVLEDGNLFNTTINVDVDTDCYELVNQFLEDWKFIKQIVENRSKKDKDEKLS